MRAFALFTFIFPALVAAQLSCDASASALCCFDVQENTPDNLAQLSTLQGVDYPTVDGTIGLLCVDLDDTCVDIPTCCADNSYGGATALGCTASPAPPADSSE
ncbi:hypothetical protein GALMADRAFT_136222 [Galerina marginata CBS 339.88]|uniref:Hydrophobin n=1 Tax=Galerina marginata (strain CBS 339.88) TaxID=685588 RepID=A0A067TFP1_GALM3|nr:hypothetical protein GALMADRAFT_136222 [Galerina marginata CBS 339.88]